MSDNCAQKCTNWGNLPCKCLVKNCLGRPSNDLAIKKSDVGEVQLEKMEQGEAINDHLHQHQRVAYRRDNKCDEPASQDLEKAEKERHGAGWKAMPFIFGNEVCEKLAAIGFSANLIMYLTQELHMDYVKAANALTNFGGTSSLTPLLGAFLADAYVGRFWMIASSSIIYFLGMSLLTLTAIAPSLHPPQCDVSSSSTSGKLVRQSDCQVATSSQLGLVFLGFMLTAVGAGGIRPCVAAFGADQLQHRSSAYNSSELEEHKKDVAADADQRGSTNYKISRDMDNYRDNNMDANRNKALWSFFNWYYFCMGASALLAVTLIVWVQDNVGWGIGFGIPAGLMLLSILSFLAGWRLYVHAPPMGSPLTRLARVLVAAFRKRHLPIPADPLDLYEHDQQPQGQDQYGRLQLLTNSSSSCRKQAAADAGTTCLRHTSQFKFLDRAAVRMEGDVTRREDGRMSVNAWRLCRVTEVEELKSILRMFPIWAAGILLVTASAQQNTFSVLQARTMDRRVLFFHNNMSSSSSAFQIPPGSMSVFSIGGLLLTIPLYDRVLMPLARKWKLSRHPRGITFLQRMGVGFFLSMLATCVAALVEVKRKRAAARFGLLDAPHATIPIPVFWLVPQYALHGIAEAFMSIGHLEFFYDQSPESMRSTATALFWTSISAGNYISSFLVSIVHHCTTGPHAWLPKNLNRGHLDYFFWLLSILQFVNFIFFLLSAHWYKYKQPLMETHKVEEQDHQQPSITHI